MSPCLLHGFPESRFSWRHQLPLLAGLGWRAIAPDLRGYGETSRPTQRSDYAIDRLVDDAQALFQAAGARRRLLIGHDWGAMIAWMFAMRRALPLDWSGDHERAPPGRVRQGDEDFLAPAGAVLVRRLLPASGPAGNDDDGRRRQGGRRRPSPTWPKTQIKISHRGDRCVPPATP